MRIRIISSPVTKSHVENGNGERPAANKSQSLKDCDRDYRRIPLVARQVRKIDVTQRPTEFGEYCPNRTELHRHGNTAPAKVLRAETGSDHPVTRRANLRRAGATLHVSSNDIRCRRRRNFLSARTFSGFRFGWLGLWRLRSGLFGRGEVYCRSGCH